MLSQLIQRQVPIGTRVKFFMKNGREVSGILTEIGRDHITMENDEGIATILVEMIGAWEVLESEASIQETGTTPDARPAEQLEESQMIKPLTLESLEPTVKRIIEIEARFQANLQTARVELEVPDFAFPASEIRGQRKQEEARTIWDRISSRYKYAERITELKRRKRSPEFRCALISRC